MLFHPCPPVNLGGNVCNAAWRREQTGRIFSCPHRKHMVTILNPLIFYTILSFLKLYANNISDVHFQADDDSSSGYLQSTPNN